MACARSPRLKSSSQVSSPLDLEAGPRLTLTVSQTVQLSRNTVRDQAGNGAEIAGCYVIVDFSFE